MKIDIFLSVYLYSSSIDILDFILCSCYKLKNLELFKKKNLVLELIQENSIENSVQNYLSYILNYDGSCYYLSSLP